MFQGYVSGAGVVVVFFACFAAVQVPSLSSIYLSIYIYIHI